MSPMVHFCRHCWREHPENAEICPSCGRSVKERLPYREALELALRCPEFMTARRAAYLLGQLRDPASVPALIEAVHSENPYVAAEAVASLSYINTPEAEDAVAAAQEHRFITVRAAARDALASKSNTCAHVPSILKNSVSAENNFLAPEAQTGFSERHQRNLCSLFRHIDQTLAEVEMIMASGDSHSPFRKYIPDLSLVQQRVAHDHISRIRDSMRRILAELDIAPPSPDCGVLWALRVQLMSVNISLEDLDARSMGGYGALTEDAVRKLNQIRSELQAQVGRLDLHLSESSGGNLQERLQRLGKITDEARLLRELDRIITERGLIEFRGALSILLDRMENPAFEIGVFGRVNSGKSSLLNHLLGGEFLPVGATPVTALPIRISAGDKPIATVEFAQSKPQTIDLSGLAEFCSEQLNPGNSKHVTRILLQLTAPLLRRGVTFVDTPGIGSLALAGAEETIAYLPRCDMGIVLVDAVSALNQEDLALIEMLYRSGATAMVLISKSDLLSQSDREKVIEYSRSQLRSQSRRDPPVYAMSIRGTNAALCRHWLQNSLDPLLMKYTEESGLAIKRKIGGLRESVIELLRQRQRKNTLVITQTARIEREAALGALRKGEAMLDTAFRELPGTGIEWPEITVPVLEAVIQAMAGAGQDSTPADPSALIITKAMAQLSKTIAPFHKQLEQLHSQISKFLREAARPLARYSDEPDELPVPAGMPVPDLATVISNAILPAPPSLIRWNKVLLRYWIRRQLHHRVEPELAEAFAHYGTQWRAWDRQYLEDLRKAFWIRAELCRARLGSLLDAAGENDPAVGNDLGILEQWGK